MRNVAFTHPLSRKIASQDIETLPLKPTSIRVMNALLERYDQDSQGGLSISQRELASQVGLSQSTVARALREASAMGFLMIYDTYIKGVGQAASRYFFPQSIVDRQLAEQVAKHPPRMSQLRGKPFEAAKPTLIVDKVSGKVVNQYIPTGESRWPQSDACETLQKETDVQTSEEVIHHAPNEKTEVQTTEEVTHHAPAEKPEIKSVADVLQAIDQIEDLEVKHLIYALKLAQYFQEGVCYIRHHEDFFEQDWNRRGATLAEFEENVRFIISDEGSLATLTTTLTPLKRPIKQLRETADYLKRAGSQQWADMLRNDIPPQVHRCIPRLAREEARP